jgi:hypothetical protein
MKKKSLVIDVWNKEGVRGFEITLLALERGYYLGEITLNEISFHVEAIEVTGCPFEAVNPGYQNRIDRFDVDGMVPSIVKVGRKKLFITMRPFAQRI